jgi:hypothetical protein
VDVVLILWNLRDGRGRIWHDGDVDRLRAWVAAENGRMGITRALVFKPFRSRQAGYGYPVPEEFRRR